ADLSTLVRRPGADNDLVDATRKLPSFQRVASPALKDGTGALQKSQPVLEFIRPYIPELVGWFRDFGAGASNYDANGHYARIQPIFNARSEEHTSELQSQSNLVCRLLLEKKKKGRHRAPQRALSTTGVGHGRHAVPSAHR